jgi:hypothetical protein
MRKIQIRFDLKTQKKYSLLECIDNELQPLLAENALNK